VLSSALGTQQALFVIYFIGGMGIGWLITRLQPTSRAAMVVLCAASLVLPRLPTMIRLTIDSFENARFLVYLWDQFLFMGFVSIGITIGGLFGIRPGPISGVLGEAENP
jgi:hypothetical protein